MTTSGKRIHVVKRPDNWKTVRERAKKLSIPNKPRDPMKVEDIGGQRLSKHVATMLAAIVAEVACSRGSRHQRAATSLEHAPGKSAAQTSS